MTAKLNKREKERQWKKKRTPTNSPRDSPKSKALGVTAAGPFREGQHLLQCHNCGGWGHVKRECSTQGNVNWEELNRVEPTPSVQEDPESSVKETLRSNGGLLQTDLYLNPDPLCRLIGEPNETQVKLEGQKFNALVDSSSMVSQITILLAKALKLDNYKL